MKLTSITVEILKETDERIYIHNSATTAWLFKDAIEIEEPTKRVIGAPRIVEVTLSERLAQERGLI